MEHPIQKLMQLMGILDLFGEQGVPSDVKYIQLICSDVLQKLKATLQQNQNLQYWEDVFEHVKQIVRLTQQYKDARGEAAEQIHRCAMQLSRIIEQVIVVGTSQEAERRDFVGSVFESQQDVDLGQQMHQVQQVQQVQQPQQAQQAQQPKQPEVAQQAHQSQAFNNPQSNPFEQEVRTEIQQLKNRLAAAESRCAELEAQLRAAVALISEQRKADCGLREARQSAAGQVQSQDQNQLQAQSWSQGPNWGQNYAFGQDPAYGQVISRAAEQKTSQKSPSADQKAQPKQQITFQEVPAFYAQSKPQVQADPNQVSYAMTRSSVGLKQREPASGVLYLQDDLPQPLRAKSGQRLPSQHAARHQQNSHELPQSGARTSLGAMQPSRQPEVSPVPPAPRTEPSFINYFK